MAKGIHIIEIYSTLWHIEGDKIENYIIYYGSICTDGIIHTVWFFLIFVTLQIKAKVAEKSIFFFTFCAKCGCVSHICNCTNQHVLTRKVSLDRTIQIPYT